LLVVLAVAFIGGAASALTPCVLPVLPALLSVSSAGGRRRVWGVVVGLEASFFLVGIVLAAILSSLGLPASLLQWVAAIMLVALALTLIVPKLNDAFQRAVSRLTARLGAPSQAKGGFFGGLVAGAPLGVIWAPCAGPILAGISVAAASLSFGSRTFLIMGAYALGMVGPLAAIGFGGRRALTFLRQKIRRGRAVDVAMGFILLMTAAVIGLGWANALNQFIAERVNLSSSPTTSLEEGALRQDSNGSEGISQAQLALSGYPETSGLVNYGPAPELKGISNWYNSPPSSIQQLRGKVILIDFWTYSCINCIRTLPYLKRWHATYRDDGLVILGVHTPEFSFEKDPANVGRAVKDFGIEYPVALDPNHETWFAYYNRYWPAHYLIDRVGELRAVHYGEGEYSRQENQIRRLLSMPSSSRAEDGTDRKPTTPETHFGYLRSSLFRAERASQTHGFNTPRVFPAPDQTQIPIDRYAYFGTWTIGEESARAGPGAGLLLRFRASQVHVVARPPTSGAGWMRVSGPGIDQNIAIDSDRLYTARSGAYTTGVLQFEFSEGVEIFAATFG
jgi:cytochrome c biogenesis protein CcdA/thiol-disulfide isomerase/thioredoxin